LHPRALDDGASGGVAVDDELHERGASTRPGDAADHSGRGHDGHVLGQPVIRAFVDGDRTELGAGAGGDDLGAGGGQRHAGPELQQVAVGIGPFRARPFHLQPDLHRPELGAERLVLGAHLAEPNVAVPRVAHAADHTGGGALHLCERAEGDRMEHRRARAGRDLQGNEHDMQRDGAG
jgi:hypothetical protein